MRSLDSDATLIFVRMVKDFSYYRADCHEYVALQSADSWRGF